MIELDGSEGEGGGQILRTSLALSMITGQPFRITRIRARREKAGLLRQHLTAVRAAAELCGAEVAGDELRSAELTFRPGPVRAGEYRFSIGTAGSTSLVLQTVLPPLLGAGGPSRVRLEGGTHNPTSPPFEFLERAFLPLLARMGARVDVTLRRAGYYPAGGGLVEVEVHPTPTPTPTPTLAPLELLERGAELQHEIIARVAHLPTDIAAREVATALDILGWNRSRARTEVDATSAGPGNVLLIAAAFEHVTEVFVGFGQRGVSAERVATGAAEEARAWLASGAAVSEHLADQLLIPLALARGGAFTTTQPTGHTLTNAGVIERFLGVRFAIEPVGGGRWTIAVHA